MGNSNDSYFAVHLGIRTFEKFLAISRVNQTMWMVWHIGQDCDVVTPSRKMLTDLGHPYGLSSGFWVIEMRKIKYSQM